MTIKNILLVAFIAFGATTATAQAAPAPTCVLNTIVQPTNHGGTTLSWKATNAHTVSITGVGVVSDADALVVYPHTTTTYTLTATGNGGTTVCQATAQPVSSYSFNTPATPDAYTCSMWVNPDLVIAGGTGILSWDAGSAYNASINGIGNVSTRGSRTIANNGAPQTFTLIAEWRNGVTRQCSATMYPVGSYIGGTYNTPNVTAQYIALNQVPYTGTNDILYVLGLLTVLLSVVTIIYTKRGAFTNAFAMVK